MSSSAQTARAKSGVRTAPEHLKDLLTGQVLWVRPTGFRPWRWPRSPSGLSGRSSASASVDPALPRLCDRSDDLRAARWRVSRVRDLDHSGPQRTVVEA